MKEIESIKLLLEKELQNLNHLKERVEKSLRKTPKAAYKNNQYSSGERLSMHL